MVTELVVKFEWFLINIVLYSNFLSSSTPLSKAMENKKRNRNVFIIIFILSTCRLKKFYLIQEAHSSHYQYRMSSSSSRESVAPLTPSCFFIFLGSQIQNKPRELCLFINIQIGIWEQPVSWRCQNLLRSAAGIVSMRPRIGIYLNVIADFTGFFRGSQPGTAGVAAVIRITPSELRF